MLQKVEEVLLAERPQAVLVYGDTNSTLAGALASAKLHIPVAHVEAGLRSFNRSMPEEINRVMTDHVSTLMLCPTETAVKNLEREGLIKGVHLVGDVMYDAFLDGVEVAKKASTILDRLNLRGRSFIVATVHRAENTDQLRRLEGIVAALLTLARGGQTVVFPVHPRTQNQLGKLSFEPHDRFMQIEPVPFFDMMALQSMAQLILTDSGGIQKEAYWLQVPCLTLRDDTEWTETVESGWNRLVGADSRRILQAFDKTTPGFRSGWPWKKGEASKSVARLVSDGRWD
jgi:UDP-N-acetylglucosamine 2-epimerase